jgi:hypothetical protein
MNWFSDMYLTEFKQSERDIQLDTLAKKYHVLCEQYDRTVCTGPIQHGLIMPMSPHERALVVRNAKQVFKQIEQEASFFGISNGEMWKAICKWDGDLSDV